MPKIEFYTVPELLDEPNIGRNGEKANKDYLRRCDCGATIHNTNSTRLCGDCTVEANGIAHRLPLTRSIHEAE